MPQKRIPIQPDHICHIWTHANGNENLFRCEDNYSYFLKKYLHYVFPVAKTYAYCLMPNYLHLMIKVRSEKEIMNFLREKNEKSTNLKGFQNLGGLSKIISQQFSNLFNGYTKAYNKKYNRKGKLIYSKFQSKNH